MVRQCAPAYSVMSDTFVTPWTIAHQAPLSMGFSRQKYWSGSPCPPPGDLPDPGIKPMSLMSPELAGGFFTSGAIWKALQFSSVTQSCPILCDPMNCSTTGLLVHHQLPEFTQTHIHWVGDAIQPSNPLSSPLLLPPIPPSIRDFFNESTFCMRWPKYWSFSLSISPSKERPGLISFRMDWLDLLAVQGTLKSLLQHHSSNASIFLGSKITTDGDCSHEIKRRLLLGRKVMTNLDSILKSRDITLSTKVRQVKAMVFSVVMYGCENWTIKKAECRRTDAFELWCWRRLLRVPWTARRSNHSILKRISPEYSLEGLMLKLKLQYFGHLI